jgi:diguanylate cyclase (GGDEF)-like protein
MTQNIAGTKMTVKESQQKMPDARRAEAAQRRLATSVASIQLFILFILVGVIFISSSVMNRSAFQAQNELIDNAIDQYVARVINEQKSIAFWDDAARYLSPSKFDQAWADVEIGAFLSENYGHSEAYVIRDDGQVIYAYAHGKRRSAEAFFNHANLVHPLIVDIRNSSNRQYHRREADFEKQMVRYNDLIGAKAGQVATSIRSVNGQLSIISAITIVPTVDMTLSVPKPPLLVSIMPIDQKIVDRIGASLLINDLKLVPIRNGISAHNIKPLYADDGTMPAELVWSLPNPGRLLLTSILPLVLLASVVAGISVRTLLRRLVQSSTELAQREASARYQSLHDSLSDLPNRRSFLETLEAGIKQSRDDGMYNIIAYVDIDHFKDINDTLGHSTGDRLIVAVGNTLRASLNTKDHVSRLGGDEFAVLRRSPFLFDTERLGSEIKSALSKTFDLQSQMTKVEVSVGVANSNSPSASAEMLLRHADIALYDAKGQGRNRVSQFDTSMALALEDRIALETDLREAIAAGSVFMLYQPIIDVQSHQISGVEALVRWRHPVRGIVSPADFIPLAERSGLMPALGALIFQKVFADAVRWPNLEVSVNLSPAQIRDVTLVDMVQALLKQYDIRASQIVFEITEGVLLEASEYALQTLKKLTDLGFKIALDDFGTGYSSLSYLRQFEFHKLKIDRSFVQDVTSKQSSMWIVQAIIALGTGLGMRIVAEGVETETEADAMSNAGCNELQGYFFSKPIEPTAIDAFFENHLVTADKKIMPL